MRTMSQPIADKAKKALNDIQRAKRLLAKAEVALTEIKGFYSLEA
jgi:hypothetical protein